MEPSSFATDKKHIAIAWQHVMVGTTIAADVQKMLLPVFSFAHRNGGPKLQPLSLWMLSELPWDWPWYQEWFDTFSESKRYPYMWMNCDPKPVPHQVRYSATQQMRQTRVLFLADTLWRTCCKVRDHEKKTNYRQKHGWRLSSSIGCPVEDEIAAFYKSSVVLEDWHTWPPFFPGDRTTLA